MSDLSMTVSDRDRLVSRSDVFFTVSISQRTTSIIDPRRFALENHINRGVGGSAVFLKCRSCSYRMIHYVCVALDENKPLIA